MIMMMMVVVVFISFSFQIWKKLTDWRKHKLNAMIVCSTSNSLDVKQNHDHAPNSVLHFNIQTHPTYNFHISKFQPFSYISSSEHVWCNTFHHISYISTNLTFQNPKTFHTSQHPSLSLMLQHCKTSNTFLHPSVSLTLQHCKTCTTALTNAVTEHISYSLHLDMSSACQLPSISHIFLLSQHISYFPESKCSSWTGTSFNNVTFSK
jgi:hypothetical protein